MKVSLFVFSLAVVVCAIQTVYVHSWSSPKVTRRDVGITIVSTVLTTTATTTVSPLTAQAAEEEDGYITTPRGLKYKVTKAPDDPNSAPPVRAQKVKAKYTLYLNGFPEDTDKASKIDSSNGLFGEKPFEFLAGVSQVIKGWDLAIVDMRLGEARKLVIPSDLGYGDKGAGGRIPGGATLYFDVELAEIGTVANLNDDQKKWLEEHPL